MPRPRVTAQMRKLRDKLLAAEKNPHRGGVMRVPRIATDLDAWEAEASKLQDKLIDDSYEDRAERSKVHPEPVVNEGDPADRTNRYKPGIAIR
jgi:hypothetical protein